MTHAPQISSTVEDEDRTICFCHSVSHREICKAIRAGAATVGQIQSMTLASTGCGGCELEVQEILESELKEAELKKRG